MFNCAKCNRIFSVDLICTRKPGYISRKLLLRVIESLCRDSKMNCENASVETRGSVLGFKCVRDGVSTCTWISSEMWEFDGRKNTPRGRNRRRGRSVDGRKTRARERSYSFFFVHLSVCFSVYRVLLPLQLARLVLSPCSRGRKAKTHWHTYRSFPFLRLEYHKTWRPTLKAAQTAVQSRTRSRSLLWDAVLPICKLQKRLMHYLLWIIARRVFCKNNWIAHVTALRLILWSCHMKENDFFKFNKFY